MNRRGVGVIGLLAIVALTTAGCAEGMRSLGATLRAGAAVSHLSSQARSTQVVEVAPVNASNQPVAGLEIEDGGTADRCDAGAEGIGNAYRCFAGHTIYAPCWRDDSDPSAPAVLCQIRAWDKRVFRLTLGQLRLEPFRSRPWKAGTHQPWGVELTTGDRCTVHGGGSHSSFPGPGGHRVIDYYCGNDARDLDEPVLLRGIDRSHSLWRIDSVFHDGSGRYELGPKLGIVTAWYATQEPATS
jgi:hypothetical protein